MPYALFLMKAASTALRRHAMDLGRTEADNDGSFDGSTVMPRPDRPQGYPPFGSPS